MKLKFKLATLSTLLCTHAFATPIYQPQGPNLTYGSSSNNQSIMSSITNPAAAAAVLSKEDSQYRFGLISIGGGYELGNVNDLFTQIDNTKTKLTTAQVFALTPTSTPQQIVDYLNANLTSPINTLTGALQKDGNASLYFDGHIPFTPFVISRKGWGGSVVLGANISVIANLSMFADPLTTLTTANYLNYATVNPITGAVTYTAPPNDSTLLVKAAMVTELGLGYSRSVFTRSAADPAAGESTMGKLTAGDLTAGVRVKYYQVKLAGNAQKLIQTTTGAQSTLKAGQTYTSSSGFGLDVGTLWTSKHYRAGAWVNNLNSPSFKYNTIDTAGYTNQTIAAQLNTGMTYEMKPQLQLEGAVFSESQNWVVNGGLDANAVKDPVGRDFQWATLSAAYATNSWWIPGARVGYRTNLAGSKLSYVTGGLTLFKAMSLDIAYGLDKLTYEGGSIPRSIMANLGLQMTF